MSVCSTATPSDGELIEAFVRNNSESAFRCLVERHARWMFAAAFRQLRDRQLAEDAAQAVFIILLQKAHAMPLNTKLNSWLFRALQFTVKNIRRAQRRRNFHEFRAAAAQKFDRPTNPPAMPNDLTDRLDIAVTALPSPDRATILLRFYQNLPFDQIAQALGISEAAARKRTHRAIHILRQKLGADATAGSISLAAAYGLNHSPALLIQTITTGVLAAKAGAAIPASILTATKGTLFFMAATKVKIIAAVVIVAFLAVPGTIVAIHYAPTLFADSPATNPSVATPASPPPARPVEARQASESWQVEDISSDTVARLAPEVRIVPTKFPHSQNSRVAGVAPGIDKFVGIRVRVRDIAQIAYNSFARRTLFVGAEPQDRYDFISTMPKDSSPALQKELGEKLGFVAYRETRVTDVLLLKVKNPNAAGLRHPTSGQIYNAQQDGDTDSITWDDQPLYRAPELLETFCKMPVIDETGLNGNFSVGVKWKDLGDRDPNHDAMKKALLNTLGLELVPSRAPVEMLIVEKVPH
jgi:RNA polymerase sigma-70 factor (ECF subfamily)